MTGQILKPEFVVPEFKNKYKIHRIDYLSRRYYFINGKPHISFTSLCDEILPKGIGYDTWLMNKGQNAEFDRNSKASFGTVFHKYATAIALRKMSLNFDDFKLKSRVRGCQIKFQEQFEPQYREEAIKWLYSFDVGLSSWMYFLTERVRKIYAVEYPIKNMKFPTAGQLDIVAEVLFNKKYVPAIIDIKSMMFDMFDASKKKDYNNSNLLQLELQRDSWNDHWGKDLYVDHVFNWSPVKYKTETPTYQFVNHTGNRYHENIQRVFDYAQLYNLSKPTTEVLALHGAVQDPYQYDFSKHTKKIKL